jgi:lysophospholipase L1-like esterase
MEGIRPVRISVLGNSCSLQVCARNLEADDLPYPELLRASLSNDGQSADVVNYSKWMGNVRDAVRDWPTAVWARWPDLVIVQHGLNEARSMLIPPYIHKMIWTLDRSDRRTSSRVVEKLKHHWGDISRTVARWDRPSVPGHLSVDRFAQQMNRVVGQTVAHTRAVCVIIDAQPVNDHLRLLGGAYDFRRARLNAVLATVSRDNQRVGLVRLEEIQNELGGSKTAFPDGIHLSPAAHQAVARRVSQLFFELRET